MNFFDIFKKSADYDPNLSWNKTIKTWEENVLGSEKYSLSNADFNYELESDTSFSNALINKDNINISILPMLFDQNLNPDPNKKNNFTCINDDVMCKFIKKNEQKIKENNSWVIYRSFDCLSKPFIRFVLKKNLTQTDISNLIYLLGDCKINLIIGGNRMISIPKLLFNFLICDKLSNPIKIFDVKSFLESNTMEEIRNKICQLKDKFAYINQKYYVSKSDDLYLDIPLLIDFFSYNMSTLMVALSYHDVKYELIIPKTKINMITKYVDDIVLMFEEIVYADTDFRRNLAQHSFEFIKMNSHLDYFHCWNGNQIISHGQILTKFIFVIVRPSESTNLDLEIINQIDKDIDITQLPQIINVELEEDNWTKYNNNKKTSLVELENIWVGQFENMVVYGIAADGISSMKNWIHVLDESIGDFEKLSFMKNYNYNKNNNIHASNFNPANTNEIYKYVNLNQIKIIWSESSIPVNIEIIHIQQNLQRIMSGMTGDAYSN